VYWKSLETGSSVPFQSMSKETLVYRTPELTPPSAHKTA
jgi:hypothetical protein